MAKRREENMTTIKVDKAVATKLALIAKGRSTTVEKLILEALEQAFSEEMRAVDVIMKGPQSGDKKTSTD